MSVVDVSFVEESQTRYLTYALSVVSSRALPDVRDGLKPVQRRILYAMSHNLSLSPEKAHRKCAAVIGEVLARYHPHGDAACYEALVRMAQDFNFRYPLVEGQGNFGSLDGDAAAAYRYTEARLTPIAVEVIGDIGQNTVAERDNFDQTVKEPAVLPTRVPNLLINGSAGIAVGMATCIPPHNLKEVVQALRLMLAEDDVSDTKLYNAIAAPDFPTGCSILNSKQELREIYQQGRGAIRMRGDHVIESEKRGKRQIIITSIPYNTDKSVLVERIADFIIAKKLPHLVDVRDESTDEVRIVLELAPDADPEQALAFLYKNTPLQANFNVNLTALIPTENPLSTRPMRLSLREILVEFVKFRISVVRAKLAFEREKLQARIHLLEGLMQIYDVIPEVIKIVRASEGRTDAATQLQKRFKLSELQAFFIVDLRIYQLSRTNIDEIKSELKEKSGRVKEIDKLLKSEKLIKELISDELQHIATTYGDARRSKVVHEFEEVAIDQENFVQHEDVHVIVTKDGWLKRIRQNNDPATTRLREGDSLFYTLQASTKDLLAIFSSHGNVFVTKIHELSATSGYGEPVQKLFRFKDGESIAVCMVLPAAGSVVTPGQQSLFAQSQELFFATKDGYGFRITVDQLGETKKTGKRVARLSKDDALRTVVPVKGKLVVGVTKQGYVSLFSLDEVPVLSGPGKGVILQKVPKDDEMISFCTVNKKDSILVNAEQGKAKELDVSSLTIGTRAKRGIKVIKRGLPVLSIG